jgi:hypothetical protein
MQRGRRRRRRLRGRLWWRSRFLRALGRSANLRRAALETGIDKSSVYSHAKRSAPFARAIRRARRIGAARIEAEADAADRREAADAEAQDSLVIRRSRSHGTQLIAAGEGRWCKSAEEAFLASLAACANVRRACAAAGFSTTAVYRRRLRDPGFAARWDSVVELGRARLDLLLIEVVEHTFDPDLPTPPDEIPKVSVAEAIAILRLGRPAGGGRAGGLGPGRRSVRREPPIEAVRDEVLRRLAALRRAREEGRDDC